MRTEEHASPAPHWEHFFHEADIGVRGFGPTRERAFEQAALALTGVLCDPSAVRTADTIEVTCQAADDDLLLYEWLNAIVFEMATRRMIFGAFQVRIDAHRLTGRLSGEAVDVARHQPAVEIKGATLTELAVRGDDGRGWIAQCVVDV